MVMRVRAVVRWRTLEGERTSDEREHDFGLRATTGFSIAVRCGGSASHPGIGVIHNCT